MRGFTCPPGAGLVQRWWRSRLGYRLLAEAGLLYALLAAYKAVRLLAKDQVATAHANAREIMAVERALGMFTEVNLQGLAMHSRPVIQFFNTYYASAHFSAAVVMLVGMYLFRPAGYLPVRRILVIMTSMALVIHLVYPLAPPRMFRGEGFVDTGALYGPDIYGHGSAVEGLANQFAAMPSMHFGWAVLVAWAVVTFTRHRLRWLVVAHPVLTLLAIVLTANHYWMDALVGGAVLLAAMQVQARLASGTWRTTVLGAGTPVGALNTVSVPYEVPAAARHAAVADDAARPPARR